MVAAENDPTPVGSAGTTDLECLEVVEVAYAVKEVGTCLTTTIGDY